MGGGVHPFRLSSGREPPHPFTSSIEAAYPGDQRFFALPFLALQPLPALSPEILLFSRKFSQQLSHTFFPFWGELSLDQMVATQLPPRRLAGWTIHLPFGLIMGTCTLENVQRQSHVAPIPYHVCWVYEDRPISSCYLRMRPKVCFVFC